MGQRDKIFFWGEGAQAVSPSEVCIGTGCVQDLFFGSVDWCSFDPHSNVSSSSDDVCETTTVGGVFLLRRSVDFLPDLLEMFIAPYSHLPMWVYVVLGLA